jgi:hypothetical protein
MSDTSSVTVLGRGQHLSLLGPNYQQWEVGRFTSSISLDIAFITCAFKLVLMINHSWLCIPDGTLFNETKLQCDLPSVVDVMHVKCRELHNC